ncbi:glutathione S-transferase N-terminal domain-containing protein, partial [Salmonella sp. s51228]|uniref:glutathione S-transferase N-terminal domain-containing protein n=1 Tax=Salmonella sp. s51228 TaxID=3159652 RepID=UPI00397EB263
AATEDKIKLYYFPIKGRAEAIRLVLTLTSTKFDNIIIEFKDWPEHKPKTPNLSVPYIDFNGEFIGGSSVIVRFLGERYGLGGSEIENLKLAAAQELVEDTFQTIAAVFINKDETKKKDLLGIFTETAIVKLKTLDGKIKNGHIEGIAGKDGANWTDISVTVMLDACEGLNK